MLAYFYCDKNAPARKDIGEIFCSLLQQLSRIPDVLQGAYGGRTVQPLLTRDYSRRLKKGLDSSGRPDPQECVEMMVTFIYPQITVIIDALDEIEGNRTLLLSLLEQLTQESVSQTKIFISSRNEEDIIRQLEHKSPHHYIHLQDTAADIEAFIRDRVRLYLREGELLKGRCSEKTKITIYESLKRQANGM